MVIALGKIKEARDRGRAEGRLEGLAEARAEGLAEARNRGREEGLAKERAAMIEALREAGISESDIRRVLERRNARGNGRPRA